MKKLLRLAVFVAGSMAAINSMAADAPKELNLGILGGQNASGVALYRSVRPTVAVHHYRNDRPHCLH